MMGYDQSLLRYSEYTFPTVWMKYAVDTRTIPHARLIIRTFTGFSYFATLFSRTTHSLSELFARVTTESSTPCSTFNVFKLTEAKTLTGAPSMYSMY